MPDLVAAKNRLGYGDWGLSPLRGDASTRQFARLTHPAKGTAIVMHTPPDLMPSQSAFLKIAELLTSNGFCAPNLLASDLPAGMMIVDDLGETDIATAISAGADETALYTAITNLLTKLARIAPPTDLATFTPETAATLLAPYFDHYAPQTTAHNRAKLETAIHDAFANLTSPLALSLRDFHSENLIWRPDMTGTDRIGLIDFQDAFAAPAEYDLASLLWDARRDVTKSNRAHCLHQFAQLTGRDPDTVAANAHLLSLQRNLRILGIFARLAKVDGKQSYLDLIPRVRDHITDTLTHPSLDTFRPILGHPANASPT